MKPSAYNDTHATYHLSNEAFGYRRPYLTYQLPSPGTNAAPLLGTQVLSGHYMAESTKVLLEVYPALKLKVPIPF